MKKILFIVAALIVSNLAFSQSAGIKIGGNLSNYIRNYDADESIKPGLGLHLALTGTYPITSKVDVRADLAFNQKGYRFDDTDLYQTGRFRVNTIDFAVGPQLQFGDAYFFAGPYISQAISGEHYTEYSDGTSRSVDIFNTETAVLLGGYSDMLNKFDAGIQLNAGYYFGNIFTEIGGGFGFSNFYNTESEYYETLHLLGFFRKDGEALNEDVRVKNIWLTAGIGYRIDF